MKLVNLEVKVDGQRRRLVTFHEGLNLVTNNRDVGRSGNSVGKSTLSRVVDFLFIGSIEPIYIDEEFKKPNRDIELLFEQQDVTAELSFIGLDNRAHQIKRNFAIGNKENYFWFDEKKVESNSYESLIQNFCFGINTRRPSVRAVIPKFIRNDSHKMLNTYKFLDKRAAKKDYSELFLYLFGFSNNQLLTEKRDASNLVKRRKRNSESLNAMIKEQKPKTEIDKFINEARELESDLLKFNYSPEYDNPVERLQELQYKEDIYTSSLLSVERKILNIQKTVKFLSRKNGSYLDNEVKAIYEYAGVKIDAVIKEFDEVLSFHENLVNKKKQFLTIDLPELEQEKTELESELNVLRRNKLKVFSDIRSTESINNITEKLRKLGQLKLELGKLEGLLEQQRKAHNDLVLADNDLSRILIEISNEVESVYIFKNHFNESFERLTKKIHDEAYKFELNYDEQTGNCEIEVINSVTNPEGGKKKAEVIAFDFSYIYAVSECDINRPRFVFHDSIEDIDHKQIEEIFRQAKKIPGQQVLSILSDKLSKEIYMQYLSDVVLLLDEDKKFFGV